MGIHWYANSRDLIAIEQALEDIERRIYAPGVNENAIDAAVAERRVLFDHEQAAWLAMQQRGESVGVEVIRDWPEILQRYAMAHGTPREGQSFLEFLGWGPPYYVGRGTNYYVENLRDAGVPMHEFSYSLLSLDLEPDQARQLAIELLQYVDRLTAPSLLKRLFSERFARRARATRKAALWLWFWASLDCPVRAGD